MTRKCFPSRKMRGFLIGWGLLWALCLPLILAYLAWRARRDRLYGQHIGERFGWARPQIAPGAIWVHAVSLGELRSAVPLVQALLARGDRVLISHFTPAGRRESLRVFATEIGAGQVQVVWVPLEFGFAYRRFLHRFQPCCGLVMEIEIWPRMIAAAHKAGVPLFMCNAQYPLKSFTRDHTRTPLRAELMQGFAGAMVKSPLQAQRFAAVGVNPIAITGELRFDQPIPTALLSAAQPPRADLQRHNRHVITIASAVEGEDDLYIQTIQTTRHHFAAQSLPAPLFVYVPRAPERFDAVARSLQAAGLTVARRSAAFRPDLSTNTDLNTIDVLLGDSLGEMYFYLALADQVIVGGGYTPKGAHNIIEPLALQKPVIVGPHIWTIEFPATEAIAAGVCAVVAPQMLAAALGPSPSAVSPTAIATFFDTQTGAVHKTLTALDAWVKP